MELTRRRLRSLGSKVALSARNAWLRRTEFARAPVFVDPTPVAEHRNPQGDPDFIETMTPWLDRPDADIDGYVRSLQAPPSEYDLRDSLRQWQRDGFVIFQGGVDRRLIDSYRKDLHELLATHKAHDEVFVDHALYNAPGGSVPIAQIAPEHLDFQHMRIINFHQRSIAGKKLALNRLAMSFLGHVFREPVVAMQTLTFWHGTEQGLHQDFPYVISGNPSHLAASWVALEDIQSDAGPLGYVPGSHRIRKYDWGPGNGLFVRNAEARHAGFEPHLAAECTRLGLQQQTFLAKKGDVFIWHGALCHRGTPIQNPQRTRLSLASHYSSASAFPRRRLDTWGAPKKFSYNGGFVYGARMHADREDIFRAGLDF